MWWVAPRGTRLSRNARSSHRPALVSLGYRSGSDQARCSRSYSVLGGTPRFGIGTSEYGRDDRLGYGLGLLCGERLGFEWAVVNWLLSNGSPLAVGFPSNASPYQLARPRRT